MAKINDLTLQGKSGKKYVFAVYAIDTEFKKVAAVYAVTKREPPTGGDGTHTIIYIGHTDNLPERFSSHHKATCFTKHGANCICIHQEGNEKARLAAESDLIDAKKPPCND